MQHESTHTQLQQHGNSQPCDLVAAYGSPDAVKDMHGGTIIMRSWKALDDTFQNAFKQGKEAGYREGYNAARAEIMYAEEQAEAAAHQVIEGLCGVVWKRIE